MQRFWQRSGWAFAIGLVVAGGSPTWAQTGAAGDPLLSSWQTRYSGRYARVVETSASQPVTTWPAPGLPRMGGGQALPAYSDVQQVGYSERFVYLRTTGLASHQMGPWYNSLGAIFGNWPANQNSIHRFPRVPQPAAVKTTNGLGPLGLWVNGVALFNLLDGFAYDPATGREVMGGSGTGLWVRNAVVVEQPTFDKSNAHQPQNGQYHYHDNPVALRYQLGDNVAYDAATGSYREDLSRLHHSPILGWSDDGYPIYGPYGYADPRDATSPVQRMRSGFVLRDGEHNTADLRRTGRRSLAKWAAELHGVSPQLTAAQSGPAVSPQFSLGRYAEDYDYLGDLGFAPGVDFDLDLYNGRFGITPEFPAGTYAYFVTLAADDSPAFPYAIGRQWYGVPAGGEVRQLTETVTLFADAGPGTAIQSTVSPTATGIRIAWSSVEGGHYRIEGSADGQSWTTVASDVPSQGLATSYELRTDAATAVPAQLRVTLTSLDAYDATGSRAGMGGRP